MFSDQDEVKEWVFPTSYSHLEAEASHLIHHADADKVCRSHSLFNGC